MFLEDFFPEPIAMCKILLYVESTEIHIAGENDMKRLAWLSVEDYAATQRELVVVSAMKGYLRRMPEKEAFKKVEAILDPKVIRLAGDAVCHGRIDERSELCSVNIALYRHRCAIITG